MSDAKKTGKPEKDAHKQTEPASSKPVKPAPASQDVPSGSEDRISHRPPAEASGNSAAGKKSWAEQIEEHYENGKKGKEIKNWLRAEGLSKKEAGKFLQASPYTKAGLGWAFARVIGVLSILVGVASLFLPPLRFFIDPIATTGVGAIILYLSYRRGKWAFASLAGISIVFLVDAALSVVGLMELAAATGGQLRVGPIVVKALFVYYLFRGALALRQVNVKHGRPASWTKGIGVGVALVFVYFGLIGVGIAAEPLYSGNLSPTDAARLLADTFNAPRIFTGSLEGGELLVGLGVDECYEKRDGRFTLNQELCVSPINISGFVPGPDGFYSYQVDVTSEDARGKKVDTERNLNTNATKRELPNGVLESDVYSFSFTDAMKPGEYTVAVTVYDIISGKGIVLRKNVSISRPKTDASPLKMNLVRAGHLNGFDCIETPDSVFSAEDVLCILPEARGFEFLPSETLKTGSFAFEYSMVLKDGNGVIVYSVPSENRTKTVLVGSTLTGIPAFAPLDQLAAGQYTAKLTVTDIVGGGKGTITLPFRVADVPAHPVVPVWAGDYGASRLAEPATVTLMMGKQYIVTVRKLMAEPLKAEVDVNGEELTIEDNERYRLADGAIFLVRKIVTDYRNDSENGAYFTVYLPPVES